MTTEISLRSVLGDDVLARFLEEDFGKRWRHFQGKAAKVDGLFSWAEMDRLLAMDVWNAQSIDIVLNGQKAPPQAFCRQGINRAKQGGLYADRERVKGLLRQGASLVLNDIASLTPGIGAFADDMKRTFGAKVAANLYYSQQQVQAFKSHYDRHEVFAVQLYGQKKWRVYKGQATAPIEHPAFYNVPQANYDRMKGPLDREFLMNPGDVIYLPRGQFHDALAVSGHSLHITFSCMIPMGLNLVEDMVERLIGEDMFRADLPRPDTPEGEAALRQRLEAMTKRISEIYAGDAGIERTRALMKGFSGVIDSPFNMPSGPHKP